MKAELTLKSGVQVVVDADEVTRKRDPLTGADRIAVIAPPDWQRKLFYFSLDEVAVIVLVDESEEMIEP